MSYDVGYFEGVRNALVAFIRMPDKKQFLEWLDAEVEDAKRLKEGEE